MGAGLWRRLGTIKLEETKREERTGAEMEENNTGNLGQGEAWGDLLEDPVLAFLGEDVPV